MSETKKILHEIHGLSHLDRSTREGLDTSQEVLIRDGNGFIHIELTNTSYAAALTPDAARYLAQQLKYAADRVQRVETTKEIEP